VLSLGGDEAPERPTQTFHNNIYLEDSFLVRGPEIVGTETSGSNGRESAVVATLSWHC